MTQWFWYREESINVFEKY